MNHCTEEALALFSQEHYTYINQIFGDVTIREIIGEMYAERDWKFIVEDATTDFEYSNHHVLRQMEMIRMYRNILKRDHFKNELKGVVELMRQKIKKTKKLDDRSIWKDYTHSPVTYLNKDYNMLYAEIQSVLDKWEKYGYWYFIKEGTCPVI